ncbi:thioredoxin fold domain-containing protein [Candidatus Bathyarchaeota archaeon]|nr:thioredoxin fold domain-containing protein [Candidatus Bathyarchaeota archaeon]
MSPKVVEIQAGDWEREVLRSEKPVVVDFWHPMCGWCLRLNPIYDQLPERFGDRVKFLKVNVLQSPENQRLALSLGILGTPTLKLICSGRIIGEIVGYRPMERLTEEIERLLEKKEECLGQSTPLRV